MIPTIEPEEFEFPITSRVNARPFAELYSIVSVFIWSYFLLICLFIH